MQQDTLLQSGDLICLVVRLFQLDQGNKGTFHQKNREYQNDILSATQYSMPAVSVCFPLLVYPCLPRICLLYPALVKVCVLLFYGSFNFCYPMHIDIKAELKFLFLHTANKLSRNSEQEKTFINRRQEEYTIRTNRQKR